MMAPQMYRITANSRGSAVMRYICGAFDQTQQKNQGHHLREK